MYISRDETTGDVVLSNRPGAGAWKDFFELVHSIKDSDAFMSKRPMNVLPQEMRIFDDAVANEESQLMLYMLDTGTVSSLIKGRSAHIEAKLETVLPSKICISTVTRAELIHGLKRLPAEHKIHLAVHSFLKIVRILSWDSDSADWYAEIRHQLVSTGHPIGELDMMIVDHSLYDFNKLMHQVRIELGSGAILYFGYRIFMG